MTNLPLQYVQSTKIIRIICAARTFLFEEGTVGPLHTTETAEECQDMCIENIKCMAYTYEVVY